MDQDDLLTRIQKSGRLHGRNESRRITATVLGALSELLPASAYRRLTAALPEELRQRLPAAEIGRIVEIVDCRRFLTRIADRLYADGGDAAFLVRVVLSELNEGAGGVSPAELAHLVPMDLRPLFRSRPLIPWVAGTAGVSATMSVSATSSVSDTSRLAGASVVSSASVLSSASALPGACGLSGVSGMETLVRRTGRMATAEAAGRMAAGETTMRMPTAEKV
ncbi:DUF2267 domain-containing protein [Actinoplanes siamensis]|uniref:DUF2267 domain-containing protein n=1 Tax=Actinoplanes siamensis TaxID=1223317 RepID=A0A919NDU8_9ACTN|nr:DUF2267 domain-containing protein [Actinoplanes siamensis]GIF09002.1 hypothetical protein Asi03nite_65400 [Actinoplanes siamensis]